MELDDNLKRLMKQLGMAINDSLSESEPISDAIADIRGAGYDVFLVLEATIGFNKRRQGEEHERHPAEDQPVEELPQRPGQLLLTPRDTEFLRSLKISFGDEGPPR